jgi:trehalose utilization protein
VDPTHPITEGVPNPIIIDRQEMYGETFDIPAPDELIFISSFTGGEVFRSGCTFRRGHGKIFFFSPGDQDYPVYHHSDVRRVIANGVAWVKSDRPRALPTLLRYDTDDFFNGHGYTGPIEPHESEADALPS